jgi:1,5-anhydro-D-fructose reductase (1,5-anhydro-D-mannitol-forming)
MPRLRIGVAGTSGHADRVAAPTIRASQAATLAGAAGSDPGRSRDFAARHGAARAYDELDAMLADPAVDAVWICSPNHLHGSHVARCAAAGKHMLVEKPLGTSEADIQAAAAAAERAGVVLRVGFQHRFRPAHLRLRRLLAEGAVGRIGFVRIHRFWSWPYFPGLDPAGPPEWRRHRATSGGWVINDIGSHLLDLMLWLAGQPGIFAGGLLASQTFDFETDDSTAVLVRLGTNGIGVMETSNANQTAGSRIEICGALGWIRAEDTLTGAGVITTHDGQRHTFDAVGPLDAYALELTDFAAAVAGAPGEGADAAAGLAVSRIIAAAVERGTRAAFG